MLGEIRKSAQGQEVMHGDQLAYPKKHGADERSRTSDLLITNQLLYQLSYIGAFGARSIDVPRLRFKPLASVGYSRSLGLTVVSRTEATMM